MSIHRPNLTMTVLCSLHSFDYLHKKQSGGSGQFGRVIGKLEVGKVEATLKSLYCRELLLVS